MNGKWYSLNSYVYPKRVGWQLMVYERNGKMVCRYFWPALPAERGEG